VGTAEDVLVLLQIGGSNRAIRGTEANEASSRSHALLQLNVEVETRQEGGSTVIRRAKLNLVRWCGGGVGKVIVSSQCFCHLELRLILPAVRNGIPKLTW
jgi:hypothetical protein